MNELDPNYLLPLWRAIVSYFSHYRPLVQTNQQLDPPGSGAARVALAPTAKPSARRAHRGSKTGLVNI
jgi:hypothetical protein